MLKVRLNPKIFTLPVNLGLRGGGYGVGNYPKVYQNIVWRVVREGFNTTLGDYVYCVPTITKAMENLTIKGEVMFRKSDVILMPGSNK